jgi:hypothetical protein
MGSKPKAIKPPKISGGVNAPVSGNYFANGRMVSSSLYDPKTRQYTNTVNQSPEEQQLGLQSNQNLLALMPKINQTLDTSQAAKDGYANAFYQPALRAIQLQAKEAGNQAETQFNQSGMGNSVGYGRYTADRIADKSMGQIADAKSNSIIQGEQLPGIRLAPMLQAANLYSGVSDGIYNRQQTDLNPSFLGQQQGFNQRMQLYNADRQNYQDRLANPEGKKGNWYTRFIDPFNTMGMNGSSGGGGGGSNDYLSTALSLGGTAASLYTGNPAPAMAASAINQQRSLSKPYLNNASSGGLSGGFS